MNLCNPRLSSHPQREAPRNADVTLPGRGHLGKSSGLLIGLATLARSLLILPKEGTLVIYGVDSPCGREMGHGSKCGVGGNMLGTLVLL